MSESMRELLHADALPLALRQMRDGTATVEQITARAADEIERLRAERDEAREVARELVRALQRTGHAARALAAAWSVNRVPTMLASRYHWLRREEVGE